jgi:indole-3-glycerol phosphate synthase
MSKQGPARATGTVLDEIVAAKRRRIEAAKSRASLQQVRSLAEGAPPASPFAAALAAGTGVAVIAEMKRASASAGALASDMDPEEQADMYCRAGAAALSVLTERDYFSGDVADLTRARSTAVRHRVPVLQKDFLFDEYQVYEARAAGADAVLLIMAMLEPARYKGLLTLAQELGMDALVEVFDERELDEAMTGSPRLVGVNNRDLHTLKTSLEVFERIGRRIPREAVAVAESGMKTADDVKRMAAAGAKAVLIGEALMRAGEGAAALVKTMSAVQAQRV